MRPSTKTYDENLAKWWNEVREIAKTQFGIDTNGGYFSETLSSRQIAEVCEAFDAELTPEQFMDLNSKD